MARHRPRSVASLLKVAVVAGIVLLGACRDAATVHTLRGRVATVEPGGARLSVDHEAIPGTMDAMRMTLPVVDPVQARALAPGDKIRFQLHVQGNRAAIGAIEKLAADTPLALAADAES